MTAWLPGGQEAGVLENDCLVVLSNTDTASNTDANTDAHLLALVRTVSHLRPALVGTVPHPRPPHPKLILVRTMPCPKPTPVRNCSCFPANGHRQGLCTLTCILPCANPKPSTLNVHTSFRLLDLWYCA